MLDDQPTLDACARDHPSSYSPPQRLAFAELSKLTAERAARFLPAPDGVYVSFTLSTV